MKQLIFTLTTFFALALGSVGFAQTTVFNPDDPVVRCPCNPLPPQPPNGQVGKWVATRVVNWANDDFKAYIYKGMAFRVKFPRNFKTDPADKRYPMIVFLHGLGERGPISDNERQLLTGAAQRHQAQINSGAFDGFALFPQNTSGRFGNVAIIAELVEIMINQVRIDPFRVTVHGLSAGGAGVWDIITRHSLQFAGAAPMSAVNNNPVNFRFSPIWHFQGALDNNPKLADALNKEISMKAANANYKLTVYHDLGHNTWSRAYQEPDFLPFLNRANKTNPHVIAGRHQVCPGEPINVTMGVTPGFNGYEWRRNGVVIAGATTNTLTTTQDGTYDVRVLRGTEWSYFSPIPVVVTVRQPTPAVTIGVSNSTVLPDGAGRTRATLSAPEGYQSYLWSNGATTRTIEVGAGTYTVRVTEPEGCISAPSAPVVIRSANAAGSPAAPTNFTATTTSESVIELNWQDVADNETGYELYVSTGPNTGFEMVGLLPANTTSFTHTGREENTTYFYRLRAINANGSHPVVTASATTFADRQAPSTPQNLRAGLKSRNFITLLWDASTDNVGVMLYEIFRDGQLVGTSTSPSFTSDNLVAFQTYRFQVRARDVAGNQSPMSASFATSASNDGLFWSYYSGFFGSLPQIEDALPLKTGTSQTFDLSSREEQEGFAFKFEGFITIPTTGSYTFFTRSSDGSDLWIDNRRVVNNDFNQNMTERSGMITLNAGTYPLMVRFRKNTGNIGLEVRWQGPDISKQLIPASALRDNFTPTGIPAMPTNVTATANSHSQITVNWTDNSDNELGFEIFRSTNSVDGFIYVGNAPANATSYVDTGLEPNTTYFYRVRSTATTGNSAFEVASLEWAYYEGAFTNLTQVAATLPLRTGISTNFSLEPRSVATNFAFIWTGFLQVPAAGTYTLFTRSDDGSDFWVGTTRVVNNDFNQGMTERSGTFNFPTAGAYPITLRYRQATGGFGLEVRWQGPGIAKQLIPEANLIRGLNRATTLAPPAAPPAAPEGLTARTITPTSIELIWMDNSTNEERFDIFRSTDHVNFTKVGQVNANNTEEASYTDTNLAGNTRYYYQVKAVNIAGASAPTTGDFETGNNAPVIEAIPAHVARTGQAYSVFLRATDPDGNTVSFSGVGLPAFASISNTGNGRATLQIASNNTAGAYTIQVRATDNLGAQSDASFALTIGDNQLPVIAVAPSANITMNEGDIRTITIAASDADGDIPAISAVDLPAFATFTESAPGSATMRLATRYIDQGSHAFRIVATDAAGSQVSQTISVTVNDVNPNFRVMININGGGDALNVAPAPWNNLSRNPTTGMTVSNLLTDTGVNSGISLHFPTTWGGAFNAGATGTGDVPNSVLRGYYWFGIFGAPNTATIRVTGLRRQLPLSFRFLASSVFRNGGVTDNGSTVFAIGNRSVSVRAEGNPGNFGALDNILADDNGEVSIQLSKDPNNLEPSAGYINALIIESNYDGSVPDVPSNLRIAVRQQTSSLLVSWQDNANNEDGYELWRATSANGPFVLIHTTAPNQTSFDDRTAVGTAYFYYKVRGVNMNGASAFTKVVSIVTPNFAPRFDNLKDFRLRNTESVAYDLVVFDSPDDNVTVTIENLPAFATFNDLGGGNGQLIIAPSLSDIGTYKSITAIATDNKGVQTRETFEIVITNSKLTTYYVNINAVMPAPAPWNNFTRLPLNGASLQNLKDEFGNSSPIDVTLINGWVGANNGMEDRFLGVSFGDNSMELPDVVMKTYYFDQVWAPNREISISDLRPDKRYNLAFMLSWNTGGANINTITINGVSQSVNATGNYTRFIRFNDLQPDANGRILIQFSRANITTWNALIIEEFDAQPAVPNVPTRLTAEAASLTSVRLNWRSHGGGPTFFEVYRSGHPTTGYALIATVAGNTTTFLDNNLVSGRRYYYRIRALNGNGNSDYTGVVNVVTPSQIVHINFNQNNQNNAAAPWRNTNNVPVTGILGRALLSNILNSQNVASGINIHLDNYFDGSNPFGPTTGNNSGIVPDNVMRTFYFTEVGTEGRLRLSGLVDNQRYNLIFYAGTTFQNFNGNTIYTVHGNRRVALNPQNNTTEVVRIDGVAPVNGQIPISVVGAPTIQYGYINGLTVQIFDPNAPDASTPIGRLEAEENAPEGRNSGGLGDMGVTPEEHGTVFPNPFTQALNVKLNIEQDQEVAFHLLDGAGRLMMTDTRYLYKGLQVAQIDVGMLDLAKGMYYLKVETTANGKTRTAKLVRE
ncbi:fibronectin type III domain-containing protein [Rhodoflexus sp.]